MPDLARLQGVADELQTCEVVARQLAFGAASELGVADTFEERYVSWLPAAIERRSAEKRRDFDA